MASELKVNKITPESGLTLTLGDSGDTINFGSGVLPNFENLTVTGDLTVDTNSLKVDSTNNFVGIGTASPSVALDVVGAITATGNITGTLATAAQPNITSLGTLTGLTTTGNINFGDNNKAVFGAGSDLQIYHDGSNSLVEDIGTGDLRLKGTQVRIRSAGDESVADFLANSSVKLYYDNAEKLATTATGIDVTGTVVSDGLTVDTTADNGATISAHDNLTTTYPLKVQNAGGTGRLEIGTYGINNNIDLKFQTLDTLRMRIDDSLGDVMFYEDTGTTPKFFWDASAEVLGIGTSSPDSGTKLHVEESSASLTSATTASVALFERAGNSGISIGTANNGECVIYFQDTDSATIGRVQYDHLDDSLGFWANNFERMRINSSGELLVGTTSSLTTSGKLTVQGSSSDDQYISAIKNTNTSLGQGMFIRVDHTNNRDILLCNANGTDVFTVKATGNVGIGTSSPAEALEVQTSEATTGAFYSTAIRVTNSLDYGWGVGIDFAQPPTSGGSVAVTGAISNDYDSSNNYSTRFYTMGSGTLAERMRIDGSGNLLLGKTSVGAGNRGVEFTNLSSANPRQTITSTGTGAETKIEFRNGNGYVGEIYTNGSSTVYLTSSDYRLKENVVDLTSATDRLKQLSPKRFNFIADINTTVDGFLAHEVSDIVPEAIKGTHNEVDEEGNPVYQGIDQSKLVPLLVASLQEALTEIDNLKARVNTLEGN